MFEQQKVAIYRLYCVRGSVKKMLQVLFLQELVTDNQSDLGPGQAYSRRQRSDCVKTKGRVAHERGTIPQLLVKLVDFTESTD